jgi:hypothetical protein
VVVVDVTVEPPPAPAVPVANASKSWQPVEAMPQTPAKKRR